MIEPEIAFADLDDNVQLAEYFLKAIYQTLLDERFDDLAFFAKHVDKGEPRCVERLEKLVTSEFMRMEYTEAIAHLEKASLSYLTEQVVGGPIEVVDYRSCECSSATAARSRASTAQAVSSLRVRDGPGAAASAHRSCSTRVSAAFARARSASLSSRKPMRVALLERPAYTGNEAPNRNGGAQSSPGTRPGPQRSRYGWSSSLMAAQSASTARRASPMGCSARRQ